MKSEITNEHLKMSNDDLEVIMQNGLITIKKIEKENYTLEDLKQSLINKLNEQVKIQKFLCCEKEIELLKIILDYEK